MIKQVPIFLLTMAALLLVGCAQNPASQPSSSTPVANSNSPQGQSVNPNQNSSAQKPDENPAAKPAATALPPQALLQGTYAISEVQHGGIVEMISSANTTEITFKPPSSFTRVSKKDGQRDFTDSGQYRIEGSDKLVLKILMSNEKVQINPVSKQHTLSISPTGDELKLTSSTGKTAVFRRIKNN